jgi:hypothetical protein
MAKQNGADSKLRRDYFRESERFHASHIVKIFHQIRNVESRLLKFYDKALHANDSVVLEGVLGDLAGLNSMFGFKVDAEKYISECEQRFPESNDAKLAAANFLYLSRSDFRGALQKIAKIKQPSRPFTVGAVDTYYNALCLKGILLAHLRRRLQCERHMQKLAEFTVANINETIFFFDLRFVKFMVKSRLGLRDCQVYLKALSARKQVRHDQDETTRLLQEVNKLLSEQRDSKQKAVGSYQEKRAYLFEDALRHHDVHAFVAVDQLGDIHIAGYAGEHIGVVSAEMLFVHQEVDHLAHSHLAGFI